MGHKAELGGEASWLGTFLWEGRFPLHIKREEVIIWTEPLLYCDHHCPSPKSESKRWKITRYTSQYILTGKRSKWGWLRMKDRQKKVLSTSHCGRPSSMDFVKSFLQLLLYISGLMFFLDVSRFCPKRLQSKSVIRRRRIFQTAVSLLFSTAASGNPGCKNVLLCAIAVAIDKCMI